MGSVFLTIPCAIVSIVLLVYILVFWIRYSLVSKYFLKWSRDEFIAPEKRYNMLLLHGLGAYVMASLLSYAYTMIFMLSGVTIYGGWQGALFAIGLLAVSCAAFYLYWMIVYKIRSKNGATKRLTAFEVLYGSMSLSAWVSIVILAFYALMAAIVLVVGYFIIKLIFFFCFSEEITVKKPGFFGGTKKVWAERNLDGSYTDLDGNTYK